MTDREIAVAFANKVLEHPYADPDRDTAVLSRQFLRALEARTVDDAMVARALAGFDCGTGDPNDYKRRMRFALEAALQTPSIGQTNR